MLQYCLIYMQGRTRLHGDKLHLYECKWSFQSGHAPKNIKKFRSVIQRSNPAGNFVKMAKVITNTAERMQIEKFCQITNFIDF